MGGLTNDIINLIDECTLSGMLLAIYMAILVFFAFVSTEDEKEFTQSIIYPEVLMFFGVFFAIPIANKYCNNILDISVAPRYAWILLPTIILAIAFAYFIRKIDGNSSKLLAVFAICILIFCCGEHKVNSYVFSKPENLYKFPQSVVDITNKITVGNREVKICIPSSSAYPFRQMSTNVHLLFGEDASFGRITTTKVIFQEVETQMERSQPDLFFITDVCRQYNVDYIILDKSYMVFGKEDINYEGYEPNHVYIGDRTPVETESDGVDHSKELESIPINEINGESFWDLSIVDLTYEGTFGQYLLYSL